MKTITIPDKVKPVFEKWYLNTHSPEEVFVKDHFAVKTPIGLYNFYRLPESMQRGVFEDFLKEYDLFVHENEFGLWIIREKVVGFINDDGSEIFAYPRISVKHENKISAINKGLQILNERV